MSEKKERLDLNISELKYIIKIRYYSLMRNPNQIPITNTSREGIEKFKIMEPKLYGFPIDEFQFLVELRSLPSDRFETVFFSLQMEEIRYKLRANKFGMELLDEAEMIVPTFWVTEHWNKWDLHRFDNAEETR